MNSQYQPKMYSQELHASSRWVSPDELNSMLGDGQELAILDIRPGGDYAKGHLFYAASSPMTRLDLDLETRIPRKETRIVLVDHEGGTNGDGLTALKTLNSMGYDNVRILNGGQAAWTGPSYAGMFTPSKAFGEVAEHHFAVSSVTPEELAELCPKPLILDCRTLEEFQRMSIPGALSCPGGELIKRALDHDGPIVVNCAGRTRSIMGTLSLMLAGHPDVRALENGTMGQALAGLPLDHGRTETLEVSADQGAARAIAKRLRQEHDIHVISKTDISAIKGTYYLLDVRDPAMYDHSRFSESISAPGGQLVQQTDFWCPVLGATLVLIDTDGLISTTTAVWLQLMGWNVKIFIASPEDMVTGPTCDEQLFQEPREGMFIVDVGESRDYRKGHLPSSVWIARSDLEPHLATRKNHMIGITARDPKLVRIVVDDLRARGYTVEPVARKYLTTENPKYLSPTNDVWYPPHELEEGVEDAMREYLSWEQGLLEQVRADATVRFLI